MSENPVLVLLATTPQYYGVNIIFTRYSTAPLVMICTDNLSVDPFAYIIAVQGLCENTTSLSIHAMNMKSS